MATIRIQNLYFRGWCIKFATGLNTKIGNGSKSLRVIKLSFCQNDPPMGESFWQKDSLITHILFELWLITLLWIVSVFLTQTFVTFIKCMELSC